MNSNLMIITKKIGVVEKKFYTSSCHCYHFFINRDREMQFAPLPSKLKVDIVTSKFDQNRWRGSQDIAENVQDI